MTAAGRRSVTRLRLASPLQRRIDGRERLRRMRDGQGAECQAVRRVAGEHVGAVFPDRLRRGQPSCRRGLPARVLQEHQVVGFLQLDREGEAPCGRLWLGSALPRLGRHPAHDSALFVLRGHTPKDIHTMYAANALDGGDS